MSNEQVVSTQIANIVESQWRPGFSLAANEKLVIGKNFQVATEGVTKIGNTLHISKIDTASAQTLAGTGAASRVELVYNQDTELDITVSPTRHYSGVQISRNVKSRLMRSPAYIEGKRKQLVASLSTAIDVACGALVPSLSTNVLGGAAQDFDKAFLTAGIAKLRASAKEYFEPGNRPAYLCLWPLQLDDVLNTNEFVSAEYRGDSANPAVAGWVWKAYNVNMEVSGNISVAGGVAHNLMHIPESHVLGYNEEPFVLPEQENGLLTVIIATSESGSAEVWDEYAVDMQTKTT